MSLSKASYPFRSHRYNGSIIWCEIHCVALFFVSSLGCLQLASIFVRQFVGFPFFFAVMNSQTFTNCIVQATARPDDHQSFFLGTLGKFTNFWLALFHGNFFELSSKLMFGKFCKAESRLTSRTLGASLIFLFQVLLVRHSAVMMMNDVMMRAESVATPTTLLYSQFWERDPRNEKDRNRSKKRCGQRVSRAQNLETWNLVTYQGKTNTFPAKDCALPWPVSRSHFYAHTLRITVEIA